MAHERPVANRLVGGCRSDFELFVPDSDIIVYGGPGGGGALKADRKVDGSRRAELIKTIRGGEHVELAIRARVFRQKDGQPNKRFLRFKPDKLAEVAKTFVGKPMLLDHNKYEQSARIGTISGSEAEEQGHGWFAFLQTLQVVKPEAVISVLDGTLDRFSIGWSATGPVLCTAHQVDVRSRGRCGCWPGDLVEVDGKKQITEYEFQSAEGDETSGVNAPAASGTRIEDVRQALAAELGFERPEPEKEELMSFIRLATILGITALSSPTDEDGAVRIVEGLKRDKLAAEQERDTARTELATSKKAEKDAIAASLSTQIDAEIDGAYRGGKLRYGREEGTGKSLPSPREERLRKIAKNDGLGALKAELAEMPVVIPLAKRQLDDNDGGDDEEIDDGSALTSAARQLGFKPKDLVAHAAGLDTQDDDAEEEE